jgi:hypothetical protein
MPTLFRFLAAVLALGGIIFGLGLVLTASVEPEPREISVAIPPTRLLK